MPSVSGRRRLCPSSPGFEIAIGQRLSQVREQLPSPHGRHPQLPQVPARGQPPDLLPPRLHVDEHELTKDVILSDAIQDQEPPQGIENEPFKALETGDPREVAHGWHVLQLHARELLCPSDRGQIPTALQSVQTQEFEIGNPGDRGEVPDAEGLQSQTPQLPEFREVADPFLREVAQDETVEVVEARDVV